jgi:transcriptional regulator with XRE-family HTH domain
MTGGRRISPLRRTRLAQGVGLRQAARLAAVDPGHLSRIERGECPLSVDMLARLAPVLGMTDLAHLLEPYREGPK